MNKMIEWRSRVTWDIFQANLYFQRDGNNTSNKWSRFYREAYGAVPWYQMMGVLWRIILVRNIHSMRPEG